MNTFTIRLLAIHTYIFICTVLLQNNSFAQCTASGPANASSFTSDNAVFFDYPFNSPNNASLSDNNRTIANSIITLLIGNTEYLKATDFGFSIPLSATICGIVVEVEKSASNISGLAWVTDNSVQIIKGGSVAGNNYATGTQWLTSESYYTYGGTSDLWGTTWSASDINSSNFGIAFSAAIHGIAILLPSARIDHVRVTVHYFNGALPLTLLNFSAFSQNDHSAKLEWATAHNDEEATFNIQRSTNGNDWSTIHSRRSEITQENKTYQYTDANCTAKAAFYRLQVQYSSGRVSYSREIIVKWQEQSFNIYPNPATDHIFIQQKEVTQAISCISTDGRKWPVTYLQTANDLYKVDISKLPKGSYIILTGEKKKWFVKN